MSSDLKQRVEAKMQECIDKVFIRYNILLPMYDIVYDLEGSTAGKAYYNRELIRLNPILLRQNVEDFIERTVPHEFAHLAANVIYGDEGRGHGSYWREVMCTLGVRDVTRCHTYDTSHVKRREKPYVWGCVGCKVEGKVTAQQHGKYLRRLLSCRACGRPVVFKGKAS